MPLPAVPDPASSRAAAIASPLSMPLLLRKIGRGARASAPLDYGESLQLFGRLFGADGVAPDGHGADGIGELELGAALIALRLTGETADEVLAALRVLEAGFTRLPVDPARPVVVVPSYNGARRQANLLPLLCLVLAQRGLQVVVHGLTEDPGRVTTCEVMSAMGLAPAASMQAVRDGLAAGVPVFAPVPLFSPRLSALLALRRRLGVRHIGHTVCKLVDPTDAPQALQLVSYTHRAYSPLQQQVLQAAGRRALIIRGTEGEAVAGSRRMPAIDRVDAGGTSVLVAESRDASTGRDELPGDVDAATTARWILDVAAGRRPLPANLAVQADVIAAQAALPGAAGDAR